MYHTLLLHLGLGTMRCTAYCSQKSFWKELWKNEVMYKRRSIIYTLRRRVKPVHEPHGLMLPHAQMNPYTVTGLGKLPRLAKLRPHFALIWWMVLAPPTERNTTRIGKAPSLNTMSFTRLPATLFGSMTNGCRHCTLHRCIFWCTHVSHWVEGIKGKAGTQKLKKRKRHNYKHAR